MSDRPKLICFDWDGTLIDSFDKIATGVYKAAANLGYKSVPKAKIKRKIGLSFHQLLSELYGNVQEEDFVDEYHYIYGKMPVPALYPGCVKLLESLTADGIQVAIVTNKSRLSTEAELEAHALTHLISSIWVAEELVAKPSPVMLHHAASSHQLSPNEVWMVGDSLPDMYAGSSAGVAKVVLVEDLPVPACITNVEKVTSLTQILDLLNQTVYQ
jgi:phosphoglycolate phosphatase